VSIVVVMPSRGRPERAYSAVAAIRRTAARVDTRVVLAVDENDPDLEAYRALRWGLPYATEVTLVELAPAETGDLVRATNTVAMRVALEDPTCVIGNLGDDHLAHTPGWDARILAALATPGIAYGDDGFQHEALPTAPFISASIVLALGWYALPSCRHLFVDNAWRDVGEQTRQPAIPPGRADRARAPAGREGRVGRRLPARQRHRDRRARQARVPRVARAVHGRGHRPGSRDPAGGGMRTVFLVPRRNDGGHRDKLWEYARARWEKYLPDVEIFEGHHDRGSFNRAAAINRAARAAGAWDLGIVIDSDVMMSDLAGARGDRPRRRDGPRDVGPSPLARLPRVVDERWVKERRDLGPSSTATRWTCTSSGRTRCPGPASSSSPARCSTTWAGSTSGSRAGASRTWRSQSIVVGLYGHERIDGDLIHLFHERSDERIILGHSPLDGLRRLRAQRPARPAVHVRAPARPRGP
jgi:hypothetical protein